MGAPHLVSMSMAASAMVSAMLSSVVKPTQLQLISPCEGCHGHISPVTTWQCCIGQLACGLHPFNCIARSSVHHKLHPAKQ